MKHWYVAVLDEESRLAQELADTCSCSCASNCPLKKVGSSPRCTKQELQAAGFKLVYIPRIREPLNP